MNRALIVFCLLSLAACSSKEEGARREAASGGSKVEHGPVNLYIWAEFLAPDTLSRFEKETGIRVSETNYASQEELDSKLGAGASGYDVVVTSGYYFERQIREGYYRKLDKAKLPNLANMAPGVLNEMAIYDPNNDHAVLHTSGMMGMGYNVLKVRRAAPDAPLDSWKLAFDPANAARLQQCGIAIVDSPNDMFSITLSALGRDPNSQDTSDLNAAADALMKIRPYIRYINSLPMIADLANGEICVGVGYGGDFLWARTRALENKTGEQIALVQPREGSVKWMNSFLIPRDAQHVGSAHAFLNYMLRPEVIAAVTNTIRYANGNAAAEPFIRKDIREDPGIYPQADASASVVLERADTIEAQRTMTRLWVRFVTGH